MSAPVFDVIIVGGGMAGSTLGGVLARAGLGVVVVEKEPRFRDRIRGEGSWPWGVAEARQAGLAALLDAAGTVALRALKRYEHGQPVATLWERPAPDDIPGMGSLHPRFQDAAWAWAEAQGATTIRPAKATKFSHNGRPSLSVAVAGGEREFTARLIVGADGKRSLTRRWTGGESVVDPEHHRMGGVLVSVAVYERAWDNVSWVSCAAVNWFAAGPEMTRLYLVMPAHRLRETGVDRSFPALVALAAGHMPEGALHHVAQQGPIGFFPNNDTWASRTAGNDVVLIGDAAGAPDPTQGHGTALLFHDVRALSALLLADADWERAIEAFADRRRRAFAVIREVDRWHTVVFDTSAEAARLREGHAQARQHDPTLGGFSSIAVNGPAGLVADEAARRRFFGEDLPYEDGGPCLMPRPGRPPPAGTLVSSVYCPEYRINCLARIVSEGCDMPISESFDCIPAASAAVSRRSAVLRLGSGGLAALLASRGISATAQEAGTPAAGRAYLAIREYQLAPGHTMEELHAAVESGFMPIVMDVPGFQEYLLVETGEGVISISLFEDQTGAEESTARAADWVQQNLADFFAGPPTVTTGSVWLHEIGEALSGTPVP